MLLDFTCPVELTDHLVVVCSWISSKAASLHTDREQPERVGGWGITVRREAEIRRERRRWKRSDVFRWVRTLLAALLSLPPVITDLPWRWVMAPVISELTQSCVLMGWADTAAPTTSVPPPPTCCILLAKWGHSGCSSQVQRPVSQLRLCFGVGLKLGFRLGDC